MNAIRPETGLRGPPMIVCSCNVLSDNVVRAVASTATRRTTSYVYGCLGCRARCGRCASTIRKIMDEVFEGAKVVRHADIAHIGVAEPGCGKNANKTEAERKKGCTKQQQPGGAAGGCAFDGAKIALQCVDPFTKEPMEFAAKPANKSVKASSLKVAKDAV